MVQFVQVNNGGPLYHYLNRSVDTGNTPTVVIYDEAGSVLVASQNATKGPNTTLDGTAISGQTTIPLTATTNIVAGEKYRVGPNSKGQYEDITVDDISDGVNVTARDNLVNSYASADVFRSQKVTVTLEASEVTSAERNCRAAWSYESNSQAYTEHSIFFQSIYSPVCSVTEQDILQRQPKARHLVANRQPLREFIQSVFENEVLTDVAALFDPGGMISGERLHIATIHRIIAVFASMNDKLDVFDHQMDLYQAELEKAITAPVDVDQDGASDDERPYSIMSVPIGRA